MKPPLLPQSAAAAALACSLALFAGCEPIEKLMKGGAADQPAASANSVAVIDLEEIALRLGRKEALQKSLIAKEEELGQQLTNLRGSLQEKVEKRKAEIGEKPTPEQAKELEGLAGNLNQELQSARAAAQETLQNERATQVQTFRTEVLPVATDVARERGLKTILLKTEAVVFAWTPESDITEEVIKRMATPVVP